MHPDITLLIARDRVETLHRQAARFRRARAASAYKARPVRSAIQLRLSECRDELERLAALTDRTAREGDWVVADLDGRPVAAVSLEDGSTLYDPFKPTKQVVSLLELRRKQVLAAA
ncbi:MAG TPA: hypothetical protein VKR79_05710 [Gaiellaceae bacterium]|nr:hypothetical protein [Gaiellaceae bacterium]